MKSNPLSLTLFILAALVLTADIAYACQCGRKANVLDEFERSDFVFIARIVSIEKAGPTLRVEKIYKGNLRLRQELVFGRGTGSDCNFTFREVEIGDQMLLYVREQPSGPWYASFCGRSIDVTGAAEDLLYLDNMQKFRGKTRVSGQYGVFQREGFDVANKKIVIRSENKTYETKTNEIGIFEIYDLPPGKYLLEPEMPKGWRIAKPWLEHVGDMDELKSTKSIAFTLNPKRHANINVSFEPDNAVNGTVVDQDGNPIQDVQAHLWSSTQTEGSGFSSPTNEKGEFRIESVSAGTYVLVLNPDGVINSGLNFGRWFYPGVQQREKAALIHISDGEVITGINMVIPKLFEKVTVSGTLVFSDETPVAREMVEHIAVPTEGFNGDVRVNTDYQGRFTLEIIKGLKGEIFGAMLVSADSYVDCPKLDALIKESGKQYPTLKTPLIKIEANQDIEDLVLRFPFPSCKKK